MPFIACLNNVTTTHQQTGRRKSTNTQRNTPPPPPPLWGPGNRVVDDVPPKTPPSAGGAFGGHTHTHPHTPGTWRSPPAAASSIWATPSAPLTWVEPKTAGCRPLRGDANPAQVSRSNRCSQRLPRALAPWVFPCLGPDYKKWEGDPWRGRTRQPRSRS